MASCDDAAPLQRWLLALSLSAVHPACLSSGSDHHTLLLHLEAQTVRAAARPAADAEPAGARDPESCCHVAGAAGALLPMLLDKAVLQCVLMNKHMQVLLHKQCSLLELLQQQQPGTSSSSSSSEELQLNVHLSAPCQASAEHPLDSLHLLLMLGGAQLIEADMSQQPEAACLVAELPLLVMPAAAQQEVLLLLPLMRQNAQAELQLQQQQPVDAATMVARQSMQVEKAAWHHFKQLALDCLLVLQLSDAAKAEAAAGDAAEGLEAAASSSSAATATPAAAARGDELLVQQQRPALANLLGTVHTLLLPLLLPFLAAHGLHHMLQLLLQCLPPELQLAQQWQQQQAARLQELTVLLPGSGAGDEAAVPPAVVPSSGPMLETGARTSPSSEASPARSGDMHTAVCLSSSLDAAFASGRPSPATDSEDAAQGSGWEQRQQQLESPLGSTAAAGGNRTAAEAAAAPAGSPEDSSSSAGAGDAAAAAMGVAAAAPSPAEAPQSSTSSRGALASHAAGELGGSGSGEALEELPCWLLPLQQFDDETERRYMAWKHRRLLHLDGLGGVYSLALAGALARHLHHPATIVLLAMMLLKALPHMPLLLGFRQQHIRCRELWVFLSAPACGLLLSLVALTSSGSQPQRMPPMPHAWLTFWRMHGELLTAGLRAFFQHMRLRPFVLFTCVNTALCMLVWAPWSGAATALGRSSFAGLASIVVCWSLEVCMRRRFILQGGHTD